MGTGPRRPRFSWGVFGLMLLVIVVVLAALVIARTSTGWEADEARGYEVSKTSSVMRLPE